MIFLTTTTFTMLSSRTFHSVLPSIDATVASSYLATASRIPDTASVAMPSVAAASRKTLNHAPVATTSTATACRIPVHQRATVASVPTAAVQHAPAPSLPPAAVSRSKLVLDRIQARRERVIANLDAAKKRSTAPASTRQSPSMSSRAPRPAVSAPVSIRQPPSMPSRAPPPAAPRPAVSAPVSIRQPPSMPSRALPPAAPQPAVRAPVSICQPPSMPSRAPSPAAPVATPPPPPVSILKSAMKPSRTIPRPANAWQSTVVSSWMPGPHRKTLRPRGTLPYYNPALWSVHPSVWKTTPAEADVVLSRSRIVRFEDNPVSRKRRVRRWIGEAWHRWEESCDESIEEDDNDAAIADIDECF